MDKYFQLARNKTNIKTELIAGMTSFLATMYIVIVNPNLLQQAGMSFNAVLAATVLVCAFSSIMMGLYANNPIVIAPGMGLNAFFTFTVVIGMHVKPSVALGAVFWSGIVFLILSIFNIRTYIVKAIPKQLRYAVSSGIGLFITFIGLKNSSFIVSNPATYIGLGKMDPVTVTFIVGLLLTSFLLIKKIKGALIIGIVATTVLAIPIGRIWGTWLQPQVAWQGIVAMPDFSLVMRLDLLESLKFAIWPVIFAFLFTDMFDSLSTFVGVAEAADLFDEDGEPRNIKKSLIVDAVATTISGLLGTSPGTSYIESATGIEEGGRTGLTAVVAGLLFLPFMFFSPILKVVPSIATAPALVLVGVFMMKPITRIHWDELDDAIPAFLAMILIPFTFSITQGIIWGFISWTVLKLAIGKYKEVPPMLIIIDLFAVASLFNR